MKEHNLLYGRRKLKLKSATKLIKRTKINVQPGRSVVADESYSSTNSPGYSDSSPMLSHSDFEEV